MKEGREITQLGECSRQPLPASDIFILEATQLGSWGNHTITCKIVDSVDSTGKKVKMLPYFIKGKNPAMFAFGVRSSQTQSHLSKQKTTEKLFLRVQEKETPTILAAKPRNSFCYICKMNFPDYLNHITTDIHKQNVSECQVTQEIRELANFNISSSSSRRPKMSDYSSEGMDVGNQKPAKRRAIQQTLSLLQDVPLAL